MCTPMYWLVPSPSYVMVRCGTSPLPDYSCVLKYVCSLVSLAHYERAVRGYLLVPSRQDSPGLLFEDISSNMKDFVWSDLPTPHPSDCVMLRSLYLVRVSQVWICASVSVSLQCVCCLCDVRECVHILHSLVPLENGKVLKWALHSEWRSSTSMFTLRLRDYMEKLHGYKSLQRPKPR